MGFATDTEKGRRKINGGPRIVVQAGRDPEGVKHRGYYNQSNFPDGKVEPWADEVYTRSELQGMSNLSLLQLKRYEGEYAAGVRQFAQAFGRVLPTIVRRELRVNKSSPITPEYKDKREEIVSYVLQANLWPRNGFSKFKL